MGIVKTKAKNEKLKKKEGECFIMEKAIINQKEAQKGITLIALVITIIVLLILAGVSIAMLTGQNGILTQAQNAKTTTENKSAEEKVKLAVMGARADDGTLIVGKLRTELANYGGTVEGDTFPVTAKVDGKSFTVDANGNVTVSGSSAVPNPPAPTGNGTLGTVTGIETKNTTVKDSLGNQVVVPAGFKVVNKDANVTDGIVVEDVSHTATAGSQFVWIPVGEVIKDSAGNKETITLRRYVFNADGSVNTELSKTEPGDQLKTSSGYSYYFTEGLKDSTTSNTHAKDIEDFKNKVNNITHGYYIGRYEARDKDATKTRTRSSSKTNQVVCTANNYVYNYITQYQAAELSRGMYNDRNFESDLMNSYAWDTAIVFLQKFDNRANKASLKPYSIQNSLNNSRDGLANKGTNNLEDTSKQDVICNVYDMASNCYEWTTETSSDSRIPCTYRGGYYSSDTYTSYRNSFSTSGRYTGFSFRSLLYM